MDKSINRRTDPEIMAEVGTRLRALRKARRMTRHQAAEKASLNPSTVQRAENGDNPTLLSIVRLLRVYGALGALEDFLVLPPVSPFEVTQRMRRGRSDD